MFHVEQIFPREEEKRVAKIVAIANQKGGVGKTTTAVNLSSCVAALGKKVLIVDLDPQGNTTTGYGIPKRSVEAGTYEVLIGKASAAQAIRHTEYRTDVIGSNTRLAGASLEMIDLPGREGRLRKALAEVQKDYDFIFIDCPPSLDLLTLNGLSACDSVLIPVQCEYYALEGLSVQPDRAGGGAGAEVLRLQSVQDHHPALHPHFGSAQLRPAHQLLRAKGQGQRGLHGLGNRICQAQPPAGA